MPTTPYEPPNGILRHASKALVILAAIPLLYVGGYLAMVTVPHYGIRVFREDCEPNYRIGGDAARIFFWPAHQVDKKLRPRRWVGPTWELAP